LSNLINFCQTFSEPQEDIFIHFDIPIILRYLLNIIKWKINFF